jgi:hypothetical protein
MHLDPKYWPVVECKPKKDCKNTLSAFKKRYEKDTTQPKGGSLSGMKVAYNNVARELTVGDVIMTLPPNTNQSTFCEYMFRENPKEAVGWSDVAEYMLGKQNKASNLFKIRGKEWWVVYNAMRAVNMIVKKRAGVSENLFTFKNIVIFRNY